MSGRALRLSETQYVFLMLGVFGSKSFFLYPNLILHTAGGSYWMPILTGLALGVLGAWSFAKLLALHPGLDAFAVVKRSLGWPGLLLFALPFGWYLWRDMMLIARAHVEIISMTVLHTTPLWVLHCIIWVALFLAMGGIASITRAAAVFVVVGVPLIVGLTLLGLSDLQFTLHEPLRSSDAAYLGSKNFYASSYVWVGFLYFASSAQHARRPGRLWRPFAAAALCFLPIIAGAVYLPVLTFGVGFSKALSFPFLSKMDSISHYWLVVENLTAVFISAAILFVILTIGLMMHCFVTALRTMLPMLPGRYAYLAVGAGTYVSALLIPSWKWIENGVWMDTPVRLYLVLLVPLFLLLARLRERRSVRA
ncbi:GerAB/ArcD/ProY family transporter [Cohnella sp. JJ-181]|uniref:GerAB/ArcD/ProY family transporter n=1 Tax=Cohnella rhizoplanae TaxID=2974897 RepID=UPI0022FFBA20|nr:GerAB/ArcD/ProY family transporter [Cohnella sp. JJ-181]CAI6076415.1 hypothetical protein COHCIP112018_02522 [Cohnella sp. JJ-181]